MQRYVISVVCWPIVLSVLLKNLLRQQSRYVVPPMQGVLSMSMNRQGLKEQNGHAGAIPRRASQPQPPQQNHRQRSTTQAYYEDRQTNHSRHTQPPPADDYNEADYDYGESYAVPRMPSSTRRYKQPTKAVTKVTE